jgi:hypothetical protein
MNPLCDCKTRIEQVFDRFEEFIGTRSSGDELYFRVTGSTQTQDGEERMT